MHEECLICGAPLVYLETDEQMECAVCHKTEHSKTRCVNGHYVCDACHTGGMDAIFALCLRETSKNPVEILEKLMSLEFCHMHGPEHHVMVGAALLTAYQNAGGAIDLPAALAEMHSRGKQVPGGSCGFWGACGAGISAGMFCSIVTKATPLSQEAWGLSNQMTARALQAIGENGGPRCCKRNSYLAVREAVAFTRQELGIQMELGEIVCSRSHRNNQCRKNQCPFYRQDANPNKLKIAFVCIHNSCRSQIAEALGKKYLSDLCDCYSAGTETKPQINQDAVRIMKEMHGIDMEQTQYSKLLPDIPAMDRMISMGCGVSCPVGAKPYDEDWGLEDPTGKPDEAFRETVWAIEAKILQLRSRLE